MSFNWEISIGTLISIFTIVFAGGGFYVSTKNLGKNLDALTKTFGDQITDIKQDLKTLNKVVMDQALSTQRQDNFEESTRQEFNRIRDDIKDLKHGKGFIQA